MPDFDTRRPQQPDEPVGPRIPSIAAKVRSLLPTNRLRGLLIGGILLLALVVFPFGFLVYSGGLGDPPKNVDADHNKSAAKPHDERLAGGNADRAGEAADEDPADDIAFVANGDLSLIDADGTGQTALTDTRFAWESTYDWSPDGEQLVFYRDYRLRVVNVDGTGERELSSTRVPFGPGFDWSPVGQKIAFATNEEVRVVNADGTGERLLVDSAKLPGGKKSPAFSPDAKKVAFVNNGDVYVIGTDGSGLRKLTDTTTNRHSTTWSPAGEKIAFTEESTVTKRSPVTNRSASYTAYDLYAVNADGTGHKLLAKNVNEDPYPFDTELAFSADGEEIAFTRSLAGQSDLYVANTEGTGERRLTHTSDNEGAPGWSPGGGKIAFQRCCENASEIANASAKGAPVPIVGIYVMNAEGTDERKLAETALYEPMEIRWRPVP